MGPEWTVGSVPGRQRELKWHDPAPLGEREAVEDAGDQVAHAVGRRPYRYNAVSRGPSQ
jgi:hypothetical protein